MNSDTANRPGTLSDGTITYDFSTIGGPSVTGANALFVQTTDTTGANPLADYAVFSGETASSLTVTSNVPLWAGIAGVQVVEVPEPSTIILLSIAGLALLLVRR
jgi:hypothetical protein